MIKVTKRIISLVTYISIKSKNWFIKLFIPDDATPYEIELPMKTSDHIYLEGYIDQKDMPPKSAIRFKGVKHRNWLMRRPIGRVFTYLLFTIMFSIIAYRIIIFW